MVNTHKVSAALLRELAERIQHATRHHDWQRLKQLDLKVRELLQRYPSCLKDAALQPDIAHLKSVHRHALLALADALKEMETELENMQVQQERAKAYQLAMTMEY